jgi:hypothetical protein
MKNKKLKFILTAIIGLSVIGYVISFFKNAEINVSQNQIKLENKIPTDYLDLFNSEVKEKIVLQSATSFQKRNTIVDAVYNNEYDIMITKIAIKSDFRLKNDIIRMNERPEDAAPQTSSSYNQNNFRFAYDGNSNEIVSKIYLTLIGDSTAIYLKNDSTGFYFSYLTGAYLQYNPNGVRKIVIEAKKKFQLFNQKKPIAIVFIKRNDFLYFITINGESDESIIDPKMLYRMIN